MNTTLSVSGNVCAVSYNNCINKHSHQECEFFSFLYPSNTVQNNPIYSFFILLYLDM